MFLLESFVVTDSQDINLTHQLNLLRTSMAPNLKDFLGYFELTVWMIRCRPNSLLSSDYAGRVEQA